MQVENNHISESNHNKQSNTQHSQDIPLHNNQTQSNSNIESTLSPNISHISSGIQAKKHAKIQTDFIAGFQKSHIILTHNFDSERNLLQNTYDSQFLRIFESDELKIDDAHEIIKEAYITTQHNKTIAIFAYSYNHFAQNALLKILEEPPSHIRFIFYITARNKLIPTIFSRLVVFDKRTKVRLEPFPLDILHLNIPIIYEYVKKLEKENPSYEEARILLTRLLKSIASHKIELTQSTLERFDLAIQSLYMKQSVHLVFLPLLLSLTKR